SHADGATGFLLSHRVNDAAVATNRLLAKGEDVDWLAQPVTANGREYPAGTIFIPATPASVPLVRRLATDLGLSFDGLATRPAPATIPPEFRNRLGRVRLQKTLALLRQFLADGGTILAIRSFTGLGQQIGLPLGSHLVLDGKPLPRSKFYVPGSLLQARVDT